MADVGPIDVTTTRTFRAKCTSQTSGVEVFSNQFDVVPASDCSASVCQVTSQPVSIHGDPGTAIPLDMGGSTTAPAQWQTSESAAGPWTNITGPPTVILPSNQNQFFRFCCIDDPTVCSDVAQVTATPCRVITDPTGVTGVTGTAIPTNMGGVSTLPAQWQQAASAAGPWTAQAGPPTVVNAASAGFWRFCCIEDLTVCSAAVEVVVLVAGTDSLVRSDTDGVIAGQAGEVSETYTLTCDDAVPVYRWEIRVDDPGADPFGIAAVTPTGWDPIPALDGQASVTLFTRLEELEAFNGGPITGLSDLTHTIRYYLRGSCDGGATWLPEISLDIVYNHEHDGSI